MAIPALYRPNGRYNWAEVEILGRHKSGGFVVRETVTDTGRALLGVTLATRDQVRFCGPTFEPLERVNEGMRLYWKRRPRSSMTPHDRYRYRVLRASMSREEALAQLGLTESQHD